MIICGTVPNKAVAKEIETIAKHSVVAQRYRGLGKQARITDEIIHDLQ